MIFLLKQTHPLLTSIAPVFLDPPNKTRWVFPALKSTSHFLPQSTVSHRSDSSSEANSTCCHRCLVTCLITFRVKKSIISKIAILQITSSGKSLLYNSKSIKPRIDPWGSPASTGYSGEHFPSRTTRSHLLLRKEEIRSNIWPEIP